MKINRGFTLAEVLLAVAIVGVIAAMTIPSIVTHFSNDMAQKKFERLTNTIQSVLDTLPIIENKQNFGETSMYNAPLTIDYENTSGDFIKRHLKVSRYYGVFDGDNKKTILNNAFGETYYEFADKDKKEIDISEILKGACAQLKNGASICLEPQTARINGKGAKGWVDINGPQGPNILGRDLRELSFKVVDFKTSGDIAKDMESVATSSNPNLTPVPFCVAGDVSEYCCTEFAKEGQIVDQDDDCCKIGVSDIIKYAPICATELTLGLDYFPVSSCTYGQWRNGQCEPYTDTKSAGRIYVKAGNDSGTKLDDIPLTPPNIILWCDGVEAGSMEGVKMKQAILSTSVTYTFTRKDLPNTDFYNNLSCKFGGKTTDKTTKDSSLTYTNGSSTMEKDGVTWHLVKN